MDIKKTVFMVVVAIALVAAAVYYGKKEQDYLGEASTPTQTLEPGVTSATVQRMEIQEPGKKLVTLTQKDGVWLANVKKGYKADEGAVSAALGALNQPLVGEVVSSSPGSFEDYEVTESSGTRVKVFGSGDKPAFDVVLGKVVDSAFTTYLRLAGEEDVLRLNSNIGMTFKREAGWRDHQMVTFDGASATRMEAEGTSGSFALVKNEGKWAVERPTAGEAQEGKANGMANMFSTLRASGFLDDDSTLTLAAMGLEPARQVLSVKFQDGGTSPAKDSSVTLLMGNQVEGGTDFYAMLGKPAGRNEVFMVGAYVAQELVPELGALVVEPPVTEAAVAETTGTAAVEGETAETTGTVGAGETTGTLETVSAAVGLAETTGAAVASPSPTPVVVHGETTVSDLITTGP